MRVYHGDQTKIPRRYVSRQRLCLRGITDYWINDIAGRPFFVVERAIDHGLLEALRTDIVPRLLKDIPNQPTQQQLDDDPHLARFYMVFDREGHSPGFFREMWQRHRISCISYHKYPGEVWPTEEFQSTTVKFPFGEEVSMQLAERGTWIGSVKEGLWVREIRKLTPSGHQTSIITTAFADLPERIALWMFSRWAQENFFG